MRLVLPSSVMNNTGLPAHACLLSAHGCVDSTPTTCAGLDDDAYIFANNLMDLLDTFDPEVPQLLGNGAYGFGPSSNPNSGQATRWPIPLPLDLGQRQLPHQGLILRSNPQHLC